MHSIERLESNPPNVKIIYERGRTVDQSEKLEYSINVARKIAYPCGKKITVYMENWIPSS